MLHIAVNTNVFEGFVFTGIWSTYMEGRPADCFVLDIAVNTILPIIQEVVSCEKRTPREFLPFWDICGFTTGL